MSSYKKYISMGVSIILIPLVKMAFTKIMDKSSEKSDEDSAVKEHGQSTYNRPANEERA